MKLYKHQQDLLDKNPQRHLIAFDMGTGKTLTAIELAKKNKVDPLIIVPKALKRQWEEQVLAWLVITKEELRSKWDELPQKEAVIWDEAHYGGNLKSQLSKAFLKYCKKWNIKYRWLLTGTPYLSTPMNIYALAKHLGYDWNYWQFFYRFFDLVPMGTRTIPKVKKGIEPEIAELVNKIGTTAKIEDLFDVPKQVFETRYFDTTKEQDIAIKKIDDDHFIARWTRKHCIENGYSGGGEYGEDKTYKSYKTDVIKDVVSENKKVAIFCRYNKQIDVLKEEIENMGVDRDIFIIRGDVEDKHSVVGGVEASDSCVVLINSSCSEGYELPSVGVIVFASLSFSYKDYIQSCRRFLRSNKLKKNVYLHLVTEGVDKDVYNSIMRKQDFHIEIYKNE